MGYDDDIKEKLKKIEADGFVDVLKILDSLKGPNEMAVLTLRLGIGAYKKHTLKETGKILGLSGERIRQIEKKALRKLEQRGEIK